MIPQALIKVKKKIEISSKKKFLKIKYLLENVLQFENKNLLQK
jgi:hypothetical protein